MIFVGSNVIIGFITGAIKLLIRRNFYKIFGQPVYDYDSLLGSESRKIAFHDQIETLKSLSIT